MTPADLSRVPRQADWPERLAAVLAAWAGSSYEVHRSSCLHFARACIQALCAVEPLAALGVTPEQVHTPLGAARLLHRHGGDATAIITACCGEPVPPLLARRGDLAAIRIDAAGPDGWSIGVVDGAQVICTAHDHGLTARPLAAAAQVWRVGE